MKGKIMENLRGRYTNKKDHEREGRHALNPRYYTQYT